MVATIRALKFNGSVKKDMLGIEDIHALKKGFVNLEKHIENLRKFNVPVIVAINHFNTDTHEEIEYIKTRCKNMNIEVAFSEVFAKGGEGGQELAEKLIRLLKTEPSAFKPLYELNTSIKQKIETIAREIYGAKSVIYTPAADKAIKKLKGTGFETYPVCMAKTQYSLSDNPSLLGRPDEFDITVREIKLSAGAGFIVAITGDIMTMPGLPKTPSAEKIDIDTDGVISGLF